jgi:hypothetical protein
MSNKKLITQVIYDNLPYDNPFKDLTTEKLLFRWWVTGRSSSGLRLSEEGKQAFELAEVEFYEYPLFVKKEKISKIKLTEFTINLGKKIKCPFYIGLKNTNSNSAYIRIYDSKIAMMISLYGNFIDYIESVKA